MPPARLDAYSPLKQCCWQPTPVRLGLRQQVRTIRSIQKQIRPSSRFNTSPSLPVLGASAASAIERRLASDTLPLRSGALATKKGMTAIYDPQTGVRSPCTILQLDRVQVVAHKTRERHGYYAVCVGSGWRHPTNVGNAMLGVFAKTTIKDTQGGNVGLSPKKFIREFRVKDETGLLGIGQMVTAKWFQEGQFVDARSNARGMGFAGGMKRHGFSGQPASHGTSLTHRAMGSAGGSQGSGSRVHPGKKMPGRMGGQQHTVQNLRVLHVDDANGLVVVNGCVSGPKGCLVKIQDALLKPWPKVSSIPAPETSPVEVHAP